MSTNYVIPFGRRNDLADRAARSTTLVRIAGLLEHVGSGSKLTPNGNLRLADARALAERFGCAELVDPVIGDRRFRTPSSVEIQPVDLVFRWARTAGFVRVVHGSVVPTAHGKKFGADALDDWSRTFDAFVRKLRWPEARWGGLQPPRYFWMGVVADGIEWVLRRIAAEEEPAWSDAVAAPVVAEIGERYDLRSVPELFLDDLPGDVEHALVAWVYEPLAELEALHLEGPVVNPEMRELLGQRALDEYLLGLSELGRQALARLP